MYTLQLKLFYNILVRLFRLSTCMRPLTAECNHSYVFFVAVINANFFLDLKRQL